MRTAVTDETTAAVRDYRASHLRRGEDYDRSLAASPFDAYMAKWGDRAVEDAVSRFFLTGVARYLDFACGTGRITRQLAPLARESWGVDVSPTMIDAAREKCPSTRFLVADLTRDAHDLGVFDLVSAFRFFGNAQDELRIGALRALNGLVRPGGYLLLNNHRNPNAIAARLARAAGGAHDMDLSHAKLKRLLSEHGFEIAWQRPIASWTLRSRMQSGKFLANAPDELLERIFRGAWLVPLAPDAVILARKMRALHG